MSGFECVSDFFFVIKCISVLVISSTLVIYLNTTKYGNHFFLVEAWVLSNLAFGLSLSREISLGLQHRMYFPFIQSITIYSVVPTAHPRTYGFGSMGLFHLFDSETYGAYQQYLTWSIRDFVLGPTLGK